jgi:hypothetical protein
MVSLITGIQVSKHLLSGIVQGKDGGHEAVLCLQNLALI